MAIFYFELEAKPLLNNPESKKLGRAFISCWVNSKDENNALQEVVIFIRDQKWEVTTVKEKYIANRKDYKRSSESLECFDEAVKHGISVIFHTWPIDAEDADIEY